jgi:phosphoglycerate dehydrogenase-like enzyme
VTTISLPTPDIDDLPDDIEVLVWDGTGERPDGAERIEMFVGRYNAPPPPVEVFEQLPALRAIQIVSAGVEPWLPVVPDGVVLCNGRGVHGGSTSELAVAGMLAVMRDLPHFRVAQTEHRWDQVYADGLTGRRVLIIGAGDIGRRIKAAVEAFDAETTMVARTAREGVRALADLPELLPDHEVVAIAVPHTPDTDRLVDAAFLAAMPDRGLLVNIARGKIVDTDALLAELTSSRLRAFLDVTDPEPLPADHPLWDAPNLLLTPHVGGGTHGWQQRANKLVRDQAVRLRDGLPLENQVTAGY